MALPSPKRHDPKQNLLEAAKRVLVDGGYSRLSTRAVANEASTQMSQIRYHFGSKEGLILALFEYMNDQLLERQSEAFHRTDLSVWEKWNLSIDYLEDDIASGYVRVLHELIAVGWSNPVIGDAVRKALGQWHIVVAGLIDELRNTGRDIGPFEPQELTALLSAVFMGAEAQILLGYSEQELALIAGLRRVGQFIRWIEEDK